MRNKKILITLLIILIIIFALVGDVKAASSFSAGLTPSSSKVNKGAEVKVTLKISSVKEMDDGINVIQGVIKFDSEILSLKKENVKGVEDWTVNYNDSNGKIVIDRAVPTTEDQDVATFIFTVSENTSATSATIKFASIEGSNSEKKAQISDVSTTISVGSSSPLVSSSPSASSGSSASPSASATSVASHEPTGSANPTAIASVKPTGNATTVYNGDIARTGAEQSYVVPMIICIAVLGVIAFVNYKKIEK